MKEPPDDPPGLLMDACVLIDLLKARQSWVLRRIAGRLGPVHVLLAVVAEVHQIADESQLEQLGLRLVEEEMEDAFAAGRAAGPISFQDRLCLLTARRHGFQVVTDDVQLRKACEQEGVFVLWGLELLARLNQYGDITGAEAVAVAHAIGATNRRHTTGAILERFTQTIATQEKKKFSNPHHPPHSDR